MRQADIDDLGPRIAQPFLALLPAFQDRIIGAIHAVFARNADFLTLEVCGKPRFPCGNVHLERSRILRVKPRHGFQHDRAIFYAARHRASLIQAAGKRHHAPAAAAAIGRLDPANAGKGGGLADRSAGIRAGRGRRDARGDRCRGTARRAAGAHRRIAAGLAPGRIHIAEIACLIRRTHRELVKVELAQHARARIPQVLADRAFIFGLEPFEDMARRGGLHAMRRKQILHADWHACHLAQRLASSTIRIDLVRCSQRVIRRGDDKGVELGCISHCRVEAFRHFARGETASGHPVADVLDAKFREFSHTLCESPRRRGPQSTGASPD